MVEIQTIMIQFPVQNFIITTLMRK